MDKSEIAVLEKAEELVDRARSEIPDNLSQQDRLKNVDESQIFTSIYNYLKLAELAEPKYGRVSGKRDNWLREFVKIEPYLDGVYKTLANIDKNRGFSIVGPERQVNRVRKMLVEEADDGRGWRWYNERSSLAYNGADLGSPTEIGREVLGGPMAAIYNVDPAQMRLTGNRREPIAYKGHKWRWRDYFLLTSMPSTDERMLGLGWCFLSRALEIAKLMYAVFQHDMELVGARMPRGLLVLKGISEEQWNMAMQTRKVEMDSLGYKYFGAVAVLAAPNPISDIDVKLVALSQLPQNFDRAQFISHTLYGYALAANIDPAEIYPVQFGALGRGNEVQIQHRKGTGKAGLDYVLLHQEALQRELPRSILLQYEQRDTEGEEKDADLAIKRAQLVTDLYESENTVEGPLITKEEGRALLVMNKILPREWTEAVEDVQVTDKESLRNRIQIRGLREQYADHYRVRRAAQVAPSEPIVVYNWPSNTVRTLWDRGDDLFRRRIW